MEVVYFKYAIEIRFDLNWTMSKFETLLSEEGMGSEVHA